MSDQEKKRDEITLGNPRIAKIVADDRVFFTPFTFRVREYSIKGAWFNAPYTTVKWNDGSTTTVKAHDGDEYDREKGLLLCFAKRLFGGGRYNDVLRDALGGE